MLQNVYSVEAEVLSQTAAKQSVEGATPVPEGAELAEVMAKSISWPYPAVDDSELNAAYRQLSGSLPCSNLAMGVSAWIQCLSKAVACS